METATQSPPVESFSQSDSKKTLLKHIEGLRGLAILLVVLFHIDKGRFPNGFMGVEVFFVISGFFFFRSLKNLNDFRFFPFIVKKLRRILIPLAILISIVLLIACGLFSYEELLLAAKSGLSDIVVCSNLFFIATQKGYFVAAPTNPFQHTWYVAVLLQLFLLCGLGILFLRKLPQAIRLSVIFACALISFAWGNLDFFAHLLQAGGIFIDLSAYIPNYYNPISRLWEFLAGGFILHLPSFRNKHLNSLAVLIGTAAVLIPGLWGASTFVQTCFLFPVCGTMLLIRYLPNHFTAKFYSLPLLTHIGKISFSLYLVHFPVYIFCLWCGFYNTRRSIILLLLLISLLLACLFYLLVERRSFKNNLSWLWVAGATALCSVVLLTNGLKNQLHRAANYIQFPVYNDFEPCHSQALLADYPRHQLLPWDGFLEMAESTMPLRDIKAPLLHMGNREKDPSFLLLGDSHAHALYPGMNVSLRDTPISGLFATCVFVPFYDRQISRFPEYSSTKERSDALLTWLKAHPELKTIVIAQRWSIRFDDNGRDFVSTWDKRQLPKGDTYLNNLESLAAYCQQLKGIGKNVILLTETPNIHTGNVVTHLRKNIIFNKIGNNSAISCTKDGYYQKNRRELEMLNIVESRGLCRLVHIETALLKSGCMNTYQNGKILYRDWDHYTVDGAKAATEGIKDELIHLILHPDNSDIHNDE